MKKKIVFSFILGILISSVAYAAVSLSSDKVGYKNTTVKDSLDNLFTESVDGKTKIAEAITNKGIETLSTDSYDTIVSNINNISTGNPNLRYDEESGYIQAMNAAGYWVNIFSATQLPISAVLYNEGSYDPEYFDPSNVEYVLNYAGTNSIALNASNLCLHFQSKNSWYENSITQFLNPIDTSKFTKLKVKASSFGGNVNYIGLSTMEQTTIGQTVAELAITKDNILEYEFDVTNYDSVYLTTRVDFKATTASITIYKIWLE